MEKLVHVKFGECPSIPEGATNSRNSKNREVKIAKFEKGDVANLQILPLGFSAP
jgi:hypothetical protein